ncbi:tetratricopeptide repeat protein [Aureivirga marina]|uniref:tetratricopeptide repeat protein n=1 Tax=Aureivirga marina TaxID=1182451 RepID=UPI0018CA3C5E|nr:tetratricopeptide repeat protein [Aureivirga marina]
MRYFLVFIFVFIFQVSSAQSVQLANRYYVTGSYEKAAQLFSELHTQKPYSSFYFKRLVSCYQQMGDFDKAENTILNYLKKYPNKADVYVDLGYNFQLQYNQKEADKYYKKALKAVEKNPKLGNSVGRSFKENFLLDYALQVFEKMDDKTSGNIGTKTTIASIYGELGKMDEMFTTYLDMIDIRENYIEIVLRYIGNYVTEDPENENNKILKNLVFQRLQEGPKDAWNQILSWLFIQQKEYNKALIQEKALYRRNQESFQRILDLGENAFLNKDYNSAIKAYSYVMENSTIGEEILESKYYILESQLNNGTPNDEIEQNFEAVFTEFGKNIYTLYFQILHADFIAFRNNNPSQAISDLKELLKLNLNKFEKAEIKLKLADILVFTNKFNQGLIYYSQVQTDLKNHRLAQMAKYKVAKTSYFKGDFDWAKTQLDVLKKSTSQLIANDALELHLLISDNSVDEEEKKGLELYAKADFLSFQNKNQAAIDTLNVVLEKFKGRAIEDEALIKQAKLYEETNQLEKAAENYLKITEIKENDILIDDAYFALGKLYEEKIKNPEKASEYYQKIIFDFPSSIYLVEARKRYRNLRGDAIN